jgi:hypothetical protein
MDIINVNSQDQKTLLAYGQQLAERTRLSNIKNPKDLVTIDQLILFPASKKRLTTGKVF